MSLNSLCAALLICRLRVLASLFCNRNRAAMAKLWWLRVSVSAEAGGKKLRSTVQRSTETGLAVEMRNWMTRQASRESTDGSMNSYSSEGKWVRPHCALLEGELTRTVRSPLPPSPTVPESLSQPADQLTHLAFYFGWNSLGEVKRFTGRTRCYHVSLSITYIKWFVQA